jgi:hypothetical protein
MGRNVVGLSCATPPFQVEGLTDDENRDLMGKLSRKLDRDKVREASRVYNNKLLQAIDKKDAFKVIAAQLAPDLIGGDMKPTVRFPTGTNTT